MLKKNSLIKRLNKILISIIELIESFFTQIKDLVNSKKKKKFDPSKIDRKIAITIGSVIILTLSYFLIPTFYEKDLVKDKIKNQILDKYNLEVKFNGDLSYGLLPKPHFLIKDTVLTYNKKDLATSEFLKIHVSIKNFFIFEKLNIKDLFFKKTEFNINSKDINFFEKVLNSNKTKNKINFEKSILFYKNKNGEVIFFTDIKDSKFFYNKDSNHQLNTNLKIFNLPFKIFIENDFKNKKILMNVESKKIRLNIDNNFHYDGENKKGVLTYKGFNKSKLFNYTLNKKGLNFDSSNDYFKGHLDFKPFYLLSDLTIDQLDIKKTFDINSIFMNFIKSEILNNQNLNALLNININSVKGKNYLNNIYLKTYFEEGNILIKKSKLNWHNSILVNLNDIQLINENNNIIFAGDITLNFENINKFYRHYQIKKDYRKNMKKVRFNFLLDLTNNQIQFDNFKIDGNSSKVVNNFLNDFNLRKIDIFNKILFKNLIKDFFINYYEG